MYISNLIPLASFLSADIATLNQGTMCVWFFFSQALSSESLCEYFTFLNPCMLKMFSFSLDSWIIFCLGVGFLDQPFLVICMLFPCFLHSRLVDEISIASLGRLVLYAPWYCCLAACNFMFTLEIQVFPELNESFLSAGLNFTLAQYTKSPVLRVFVYGIFLICSYFYSF